MVLVIGPATVAHSAVVSGLSAAVLIPGCVLLALALYLMVLSVAALFYREDEGDPSAPVTTVSVLVPAHDEEAVIERCVQGLLEQTYPSHMYRIVVIADNCTDNTAVLARKAGAHRVMVRDAPEARGKGQALRWALDRILGRTPAPNAVVIVDADSTPDSGLLAGLVRRFEGGAPVVQGMYLLSAKGRTEPSLGELAFTLVNRVRPAGLSVLGLSVGHLAGNGMLLSRDVLVKVPWTAFTSTEDWEYSLLLHAAGERIVFAGDAAVFAAPAPNATAAAQQQLRWHGGKMHLARMWLPRLIYRGICHRRPALLGVALALAVPPLGLFTSAVAGGVAGTAMLAAVGITPAWTLLPWLGAAALIPTSVIIGLCAARTPVSDYRALLRAPQYIVRMVRGAHRVLGFRGDTWVRTQREPTSADDL